MTINERIAMIIGTLVIEREQGLARMDEMSKELEAARARPDAMAGQATPVTETTLAGAL